MANEAQITAALTIVKGNVQYASRPSAFVASVSGAKGPTPGSFSASIAGTDVDLSNLTSPGLCRIANQDDTYSVDVGIYDPETARFYPLIRLLPGEFYVIRLSPNVQEEYGTGTGTLGADTNRMRVKAITAAAQVSVEAFEA